MTTLVRAERIDRAILVIRDQKVVLDADLAELYGVTTKRLNEQVKGNRDRFPEDFIFRLTAKEKAEVVAKHDHLQRLKFSPTLPHAFTEHGALSIQIVRVFIRMREAIVSHKDLRRRLDALEKKYDAHDAEIKDIFDAIHKLMGPPTRITKRRIGFLVEAAE